MMQMRNRCCVVPMLVLLAGASLSADRVKLRSGKVVEGMFMGADSKSVRLLLDDGQVWEAAVEETVAVEFSARKPAPKPAPAAKPAPVAASAPAPARAAAPAPRTVTVPAGTTLNVRLTQTIDVDASQAGMTFKGIIDDPVLVNGSIVIPRGGSAILQAAKVEQSGNFKGSDKISLKVNAINFGGRVYEVATSYVETKGKGEGRRTTRKVGGGAGLGAIVGGIAGGGEGAAIGAAIGGVTGAAVASGGEEHLKIPAETRLQFQLTSAIKVLH